MEFDQLLAVDDAGIWKPPPGAYQDADRMCDTALADMVLVAVHPWDIGTARGGLPGRRSSWL